LVLDQTLVLSLAWSHF